MPVIAVVIPTRNRPTGLRACLEALAAQSIHDFEVVVIDDGSELPVARGLEAFTDDRLDLHVLVNDRQRGPAHARNRGIAATTARYIAFVDDDVRVVPDWLESHLAAHQASQVPVASIGPLAAPADWQAQPWTRWEADTLQRQYNLMVRGVYEATWRQFHTGNAFVERDAILEVGGFDEQFRRAEDIELGLRLAHQGLGFTFLPHALGWHYSSRSLEAWLAVARAYGQFDQQLDRMYPQLRWMRRVRRELRRRHPLLKAIRILAGNRAVRGPAAQAAARFGAAAYAAGLARAARGALSAAYDLEYLSGLEGPTDEGAAAPRQARLRRT